MLSQRRVTALAVVHHGVIVVREKMLEDVSSFPTDLSVAEVRLANLDEL